MKKLRQRKQQQLDEQQLDETIAEAIELGLIRAVEMPDGQIGYELTELGTQAAIAQELDDDR